MVAITAIVLAILVATGAIGTPVIADMLDEAEVITLPPESKAVASMERVGENIRRAFTQDKVTWDTHRAMEREWEGEVVDRDCFAIYSASPTKLAECLRRGDELRDEISIPGCVCPLMVYDPVCGVDGKTYASECHARCANVQITHEGVCEEQQNILKPRPKPPIPETPEVPEIVCPAIFDPVCGEDGATYPNDCEASRAMVKIAYRGECRVEEPIPTPIHPILRGTECIAECPYLYAPVCGVDGRTYTNSCIAGCAGVKIAHQGACV